MSDSEIEERLESPKNLVRVIEKSRGGKVEGSTNIPSSVRDLISITRNSGDKCKDVAEEFGIDESSVSEISRGMVGGRLDKDLQGVGRKVKEDKEESAHNAALEVLMTSMRQLQPKLADPEVKIKELSKVASDMARVASLMKGEKTNSITNNTQVILIATPKKKLDSYEFIEA